MAGITAAVELAETGREVVLVEKEPYLGGKVARFSSYFPKLCPPSCGLEINFRRIRSNPRIRIYTGAEVTRLDGEEGRFSVDIRLAARLINLHCTSCGRCAEVCPEGAVYVPGELAFPMSYSIDPDKCKREACAKCLEVCAFDAIQLAAQKDEIRLQASRVILATGWELYDATRLEEYAYASDPDVITSLEFEEMMRSCSRDNQALGRPSDGKQPAHIAFVQCAGSRDLNHLPYCSAICCSASLKHSLSLAEMARDYQSELFYIDLRVSGRNEKLLKRAEDSKQIKLTKGKVGRIHRGQAGPVLQVEDIEAGGMLEKEFDMVVLALGMVPRTVPGNLTLNPEGFLLERQEAGLSVAGSCKRPMDVSSTVKDATAAALKSMKL